MAFSLRHFAQYQIAANCSNKVLQDHRQFVQASFLAPQFSETVFGLIHFYIKNVFICYPCSCARKLHSSCYYSSSCIFAYSLFLFYGSNLWIGGVCYIAFYGYFYTYSSALVPDYQVWIYSETFNLKKANWLAQTEISFDKKQRAPLYLLPSIYETKINKTTILDNKDKKIFYKRRCRVTYSILHVYCDFLDSSDLRIFCLPIK